LAPDQATEEAEAWKELVDGINQFIQFWPVSKDMPEELREQRLSTLATGRLNAIRRYKRVTARSYSEQHRISPSMRRQLEQEWRAAGAVCGICGHDVAEDEAIHLHHIRPVTQGGTKAKENLTYAHEGCNLHLHDEWVEGEDLKRLRLKWDRKRERERKREQARPQVARERDQLLE
jgi:hypothetical protein